MDAQNRSYAEPPDPLLRSYFPAVAAGLVGFDVGLRAEQPGNVALEVLVDVLASHMEPGPAFYPDGELTDEPEETLMAELIREAALEGLGDELPHSLAVVIEEVVEREGRTE